VRIAACSALLAAFLVAAPFAGGATGWVEGYHDATGDSGRAADLQELIVGSDDTGEASFVLPDPLPLHAGDVVTLFVDADADGTTGDVKGADYRFVARGGNQSARLERWNGGAWAAAPALSARGGTRFGVGFFVNRRDLRNAGPIRVWVESAAGNDVDRLPDSGAIAYDLRPLKLPTTFRASIGRRTATLALVVRRTDTGGFVAELPLCQGRVAGKSRFATSLESPSQRNGYRGSCTWRFPKSAVGKRARLTITVQFGERTVTRVRSFVVR
jgi:hypothetical protein